MKAQSRQDVHTEYPVWMVRLVNTPIRRLEGITYWVIEDPNGIADLINTEIRREWEEDAKSEHRDPKKDEWLSTLSKRAWNLRTTDLDRIRLNLEIMNYADRERGYIFLNRLAQRTRELQKVIENFGIVIWPLIVREEDTQLVDGYCRYATLKAMNISRTYVYAGTLKKRALDRKREKDNLLL